MEERVRDGYSLSLRSHVCAELGLEAGSDLIKKHDNIMKVTDCYFDIIKEHKLGKLNRAR